MHARNGRVKVMRVFVAGLVLAVAVVYALAGVASRDIENYRNEIDKWLAQVDRDLLQFNAISAQLSWEMMMGKSNERMQMQADALISVRNSWKNRVCGSNIKRTWLNETQKRKIYLMCRGPKFTDKTAKEELAVLNEMRDCYQLKICFDENISTPLESLSSPKQDVSKYPKAGECLQGEPDLEWLMKRADFNSEQLKWIWKTFHNPIGRCMHRVYPKVIRMQNDVAKANGYSDMGEVWRDELEMPDLESDVMELYEEIKPLYDMLHGVVRHLLLQKHGPTVVDPIGALPIHLLGNMWGQNWSPLIELFIQLNGTVNLNEKLKLKNWTVHDMVMQAEDFYTSMGLEAMMPKFWTNSVFEEGQNTSTCHGTAANLYKGDDYRILLCAKVNMEDFYIIHHEMGHIEYNMAYRRQPTIFQEGTNSAFHETIGDVIMHGVMVPQHLHRLSLLSDDDLLEPEVDLILLLEQALGKIEEVPFALIIDKFRWDVFSGKITDEHYNADYWSLNQKLRGVAPPETRSDVYMDAGAKFHVPDNTPYIRYFLSSILQMQVFKGLCELSLFGRHRDVEEALTIPLHKCDIYGCKKCGKILHEMMSLGASIHWTEALRMLSGKDYITTKPFLEYYEPVYHWLRSYIKEKKVPIGW